MDNTIDSVSSGASASSSRAFEFTQSHGNSESGHGFARSKTSPFQSRGNRHRLPANANNSRTASRNEDPSASRGVSSGESRGVSSGESRGVSSGESRGVAISKSYLRALCRTLLPHAHEVRSQLKGKPLQAFAELMDLIAKDPSGGHHQTIMAVSGEVFGEIEPTEDNNTVADFFISCRKSKSFPGQSGCSAECAGNLPPELKPKYLCSTNVAVYKNGVITTTHTPSGGSDTILIHSAEANFSLSREVIDKLRQAGVSHYIISHRLGHNKYARQSERLPLPSNFEGKNFTVLFSINDDAEIVKTHEASTSASAKSPTNFSKKGKKDKKSDKKSDGSKSNDCDESEWSWGWIVGLIILFVIILIIIFSLCYCYSRSSSNAVEVMNNHRGSPNITVIPVVHPTSVKMAATNEKIFLAPQATTMKTF